MDRSLLLTIAIASGVSGACSTPLSPSEWLALRDAEARWTARPFEAYTFETRASCFCDPITLQWARLEVSNDSVTRVVLVDTGEEIGPPQQSHFPSVERLFALIRSAQAEDGVKDIIVEYDPALGYPTFIRIVPEDGVMDGGSEHFARNLAPVP